MAHLFRFFGVALETGVWEIAGEECLHLRKIVRLDVGAALEICDGLGLVVEAVLEGFSGQKATARVTRTLPSQPKRTPIAVAVGALKPQSFDDVIPDLVEIGVDMAWIFLQEKSAKARVDDKILDRWQRIARAAAKQAKQSRLIQLHASSDLDTCLTHAQNLGFSTVRGLDAGGHSGLLEAKVLEPTLLVVGGEMGLSDQEMELIKTRKGQIFSLPTGILRATTAVTLGAGLLALQR